MYVYVCIYTYTHTHTYVYMYIDIDIRVQSFSKPSAVSYLQRVGHLLPLRRRDGQDVE